MEAAFARVNAFNERLHSDGNWVYACGLTAPEAAKVVSPAGDATSGPAVTGNKQLGGFWIIDAPSAETAATVAARGAKVCGQPVEIRAMEV